MSVRILILQSPRVRLSRRGRLWKLHLRFVDLSGRSETFARCLGTANSALASRRARAVLRALSMAP